MPERAALLHRTADAQIAELIELASGLDDASLRQPFPARQKLGDGTVGASVWHTAGNYARIAAFVAGHEQMTDMHGPVHTADLAALREELDTTREVLGSIAQLTDSELDAIPPSGSFKLCDGQRTLEQVLAGLLKHQRHQLDALQQMFAI